MIAPHMFAERIAVAAVLAFSTGSAAAQQAEAFDCYGGWLHDSQFMDQMGSPFLLAHGLGESVADARTTVRFPAPGTYRVWVRTRDWVAPWNAPGAPGRFQLLVDGKPLETVFGTEGAEWHWQEGGTVEITGRSGMRSRRSATRPSTTLRYLSEPTPCGAEWRRAGAEEESWMQTIQNPKSKIGFYARGASGGHRHHRHLDCPAAAGGAGGAGGGPAVAVREPSEANRPNSGVPFAAFRDGTSNTIIVGERHYETRSWVTGSWYSGSRTNMTKICNYNKNVTWPINSDPDQIGYYVYSQIAPPGAQKSVLFNDLHYGSRHPGGAQFLLGDGSVHFLSETMDFTTFQDMATIAGGEVISWEQ